VLRWQGCYLHQRRKAINGPRINCVQIVRRWIVLQATKWKFRIVLDSPRSTDEKTPELQTWFEGGVNIKYTSRERTPKTTARPPLRPLGPWKQGQSPVAIYQLYATLSLLSLSFCHVPLRVNSMLAVFARCELNQGLLDVLHYGLRSRTTRSDPGATLRWLTMIVKRRSMLCRRRKFVVPCVLPML